MDAVIYDTPLRVGDGAGLEIETSGITIRWRRDGSGADTVAGTGASPLNQLPGRIIWRVTEDAMLADDGEPPTYTGPASCGDHAEELRPFVLAERITAVSVG